MATHWHKQEDNIPTTTKPITHTIHNQQSIVLSSIYERAKCLQSKPSIIFMEKKHLSSYVVSNGYPSSFMQRVT